MGGDHKNGLTWQGDRICSRFRRGEVQGPCCSFCYKHSTRKTRRTTEQHGEAFLVGHAAANPRASVILLHSMPTHVAAIGTAPCRSVVLRALRVKCLQQNEALGPTATARLTTTPIFRQMRLPCLIWLRADAGPARGGCLGIRTLINCHGVIARLARPGAPGWAFP